MRWSSSSSARSRRATGGASRPSRAASSERCSPGSCWTRTEPSRPTGWWTTSGARTSPSRRRRWCRSTSRSYGRCCRRTCFAPGRRDTRSRSTRRAIDLVRFERLRREGEAAHAAGNADLAAERFREALTLWRGDPLAEFQEPFARVEAARLDRAPPRLRRGADRRRPRPRASRRACRRARCAGRAASAARRPAGAAAARPLPLGPPVRGALELPGVSHAARRRARARAVGGAQGDRAPDPQARLRPRPRGPGTGSSELRPEVQYVTSGDVSIAYQVVGDGAGRPRPRARLGVQLPARAGSGPQLASFYKRLAAHGTADPVRQARDGALGPGGRGSLRSRSGWTTCAR